MRGVRVRAPRLAHPLTPTLSTLPVLQGPGHDLHRDPGQKTRTLFRGKWLWVEILVIVSSAFERNFFLLKFHLLR